MFSQLYSVFYAFTPATAEARGIMSSGCPSCSHEHDILGTQEFLQISHCVCSDSKTNRLDFGGQRSLGPHKTRFWP